MTFSSKVEKSESGLFFPISGKTIQMKNRNQNQEISSPEIGDLKVDINRHSSTLKGGIS